MLRKRPPEEIQLNVTAMLDMAFQLLAFFVLTFRPAASEPGFLSHMPPATPVVDLNNKPDIADDRVTLEKAIATNIKTLRIDLFSESGGLDRIAVDGHPADSLNDLHDKMTLMLANPSTPVEQIVVQSGDRLNYATVMQVVGFCSEYERPKTDNGKNKELFKLRLVALGDGPD